MPDGRPHNFSFPHWVLTLISNSSPIFLCSSTCLYFLPDFGSLCVWSILFTLGFKFCASLNFQQLDSLTEVYHLLLGFCLLNRNQGFLWFCKLNGYSSILFCLIWTEPLDRFAHFKYFKLRWESEIFQVREPLTDHCLSSLYFWGITQALFSSLQKF